MSCWPHQWHVPPCVLGCLWFKAHWNCHRMGDMTVRRSRQKLNEILHDRADRLLMSRILHFQPAVLSPCKKHGHLCAGSQERALSQHATSPRSHATTARRYRTCKKGFTRKICIEFAMVLGIPTRYTGQLSEGMARSSRNQYRPEQISTAETLVYKLSWGPTTCR